MADSNVVAVTGVSEGVGETIAEVFAGRGQRVVGCARNEERGRDLEERIRSAGGTFTFRRADLTIREECFGFVDAVLAEHGRIDVLIANAGGPGHPSITPTADVVPEQWDAVIDLNLTSVLHCCQRAIPAMQQQRSGVILTVASTQAIEAVAKMAAYNAAKAGLVQLTRTLAVEYLADGIRANVVILGGAATAASAQVFGEGAAAAGRPDLVPGDFTLPKPLHAIRRSDIATALFALAGDDARAITGATIAIDRAMTAGSLYSEAIGIATAGRWPAPDA